MVVFDASAPARHRLSFELARRGVEAWCTGELREAADLLRAHRPTFAVSEDNLHRPWIALSRLIRDCRLGTRVVVLTAYASVSSAVRATKLGVLAYLAKPLSGDDLLDVLSGGNERRATAALACAPLSLHRLRWERLNAVLDERGSIRAAAESLRLDRRSLRRMLSTYPPAAS